MKFKLTRKIGKNFVLFNKLKKWVEEQIKLNTLIHECFSLDNITEVKDGIDYGDTEWFEQASYSELVELSERLMGFKNTLQGINLDRGYVRSTNIFGEDYPIIKDVAEKYISKLNYANLKPTEKSSVYNWICYDIMLDIYTITNLSICRINNLIQEEIDNNMFDYETEKQMLLLDLLSITKIFRHWAHGLLPNSVKQHLVKRKVKIVGNIYTGYDTEYKPIDIGINRLVSAQLAITGNLKLKVPINKDYIIEGVNSLTSESYLISPPKLNDVPNLIKEFDRKIKLNRTLLHGKHDQRMIQICNYFITHDEDIDNIKENDQGYIFQFKKLPIVRNIILNAEGETLTINFDTLNYIINNKVNMEIPKLQLFTEILNITDGGEEELLHIIPKNNKSWNNETMQIKPIEVTYLNNEENSRDKENFNIVRKVTSLDDLEIIASKLAKSPYKIEKEEEEEEEETEISSPFAAPNKEEESSLTPLASSFDFSSVNFSTKNYLVAHYNAADLSLIEDWNEISYKNIDVVKKSFLSLSKPMKTLNHNIYIRDSLLLSSAAAKTLDAVGKAHYIPKISIPEHYYHKMDQLLIDNRELFINYAINDSLITIIHALFMNDFNFNLGKENLPTTLGSIAECYVKNKWAEEQYRGYQISGEFLLSDRQNSFTPKGLNSFGIIGNTINMFIASYRGGRNECFMRGIDTNTKWYDYDLTSCYSTVMSMCGDPLMEESLNSLDFDSLSNLAPNILTNLGDPDYDKLIYLTENHDINKLNFKESYSALNVDFNLPNNIKFPPIPVSVNKNLTVYPLSGNSTITGPEFLSAYNILQKALKNVKGITRNAYYIKIKSGCYIPFKKAIVDEELVLKYPPFFSVINDLQANRRMHPKKSAMERIFKDLGNMLYGKVVSGISNKKVFDSRLIMTKNMTSNSLTNPIIGAFITGFVRALLAELLNQVHWMGGRITAVTTDGFVCDIPDLESKIVKENTENGIEDSSFLGDYRNTRFKLSKNSEALEVKTSVRGILQWSTRGQLSDVNTENVIKISAMTGFQSYHFTHEAVVDFVKEAFSSKNIIYFLQNRLTGAKDNYDFNFDVSMVNSVRKFRTAFDSKRAIVLSDNSLLDTSPFVNYKIASLHNTLLNQYRSSIFSHEYSRSNVFNDKTSVVISAVAVINLILQETNFKVTNMEKQHIIDLISSTSGLPRDHVTNTINKVLINFPAPILNTVSVFENNKKFIHELFNYLSEAKYSPFNNLPFLIKFSQKFAKFELPALPIKNAIIEK